MAEKLKAGDYVRLSEKGRLEDRTFGWRIKNTIGKIERISELTNKELFIVDFNDKTRGFKREELERIPEDKSEKIEKIPSGIPKTQKQFKANVDETFNPLGIDKDKKDDMYREEAERIEKESKLVKIQCGQCDGFGYSNCKGLGTVEVNKEENDAAYESVLKKLAKIE